MPINLHGLRMASENEKVAKIAEALRAANGGKLIYNRMIEAECELGCERVFALVDSVVSYFGIEAVFMLWEKQHADRVSAVQVIRFIDDFYLLCQAKFRDECDVIKSLDGYYCITLYLIPKMYNSTVDKKSKEIELEFRRRQEQREQLEKELELDWSLYLEKLDEALRIHSAALIRNMRSAYQKDEYGAVVRDERETEIERFLRSVNLIGQASKHNFKKTIQHVNRWHAKQKHVFEQSNAMPENGHDFEHWVAAKLNKTGWKATVTQASGDNGVDVIAERKGLSVAVQCKRYKGSVGNKAVQEVYSGMKHMQLDKAVVISTGKYTNAAQNIASTTGVLLLSEHDIPYLWDLLQG